MFIILTLMLQTAGVADDAPACGIHESAQELALLIASHESQQRVELQCNELLARVAATRAVDLADGSEEGDLTPNEVLIENGFKFPSFYPPVGNQVQAHASDVDTPEAALEFLVRSFKHRDLILGDDEFFSRQTQMGVGYHQSPDGMSHYVVFIAEPHTSPKLVIRQEFTAPRTITDVECGKSWRLSTNDEYRKVCRERWLKEKDRDRE